MSGKVRYSRAPRCDAVKTPQKIKEEKERTKRQLNMTEHHRLSRNRGGGASRDNIILAGWLSHQSYHAIFDSKKPVDVCDIVNDRFENDGEYLVAIPIIDFNTCLQYLVNSGVLRSYDFNVYGVTWNHIQHYGNQTDLVEQFPQGQQELRKVDPIFDHDACVRISYKQRWDIVFPKPKLQIIAYQLTKYWLQLDVVIIAIPRQHFDLVEDLLTMLIKKKNKK